MVAVLYDLKHLGSELHLVPERVRNGLRQRCRTAHNVAGETGALVPHQQKVAYAGPGRNFGSPDERETVGRKKASASSDSGPVNSENVLSAMKS